MCLFMLIRSASIQRDPATSHCSHGNRYTCHSTVDAKHRNRRSNYSLESFSMNKVAPHAHLLQHLHQHTALRQTMRTDQSPTSMQPLRAKTVLSVHRQLRLRLQEGRAGMFCGTAHKKLSDRVEDALELRVCRHLSWRRFSGVLGAHDGSCRARDCLTPGNGGRSLQYHVCVCVHGLRHANCLTDRSDISHGCLVGSRPARLTHPVLIMLHVAIQTKPRPSATTLSDVLPSQLSA